MRSIQRSLRLDEDLNEFIKTLPPNTTNGLINELIRLFKDNRAVQDMIRLRDARFTNWAGVDNTVPKVVINPAADLAAAVEKPVDKPESILDEIVPD